MHTIARNPVLLMIMLYGIVFFHSISYFILVTCFPPFPEFWVLIKLNIHLPPSIEPSGAPGLYNSKRRKLAMKNLFVPFAVITMLFIASCGENESSTSSSEEGAEKGETTTVNGVEFKIIPGLTAVDVHGSMEKIGFQTEKNIGADISTWRSKMSDQNGSYEVVVTGNGPQRLTSVDARYFALSDANFASAAQFMQFVSTVPYKNANPEVAKAWVGRNANKGGDTLINGVKFRITARDNMSRTLYISVPD
jgi:hypothetical protein